LLKGATHAQPGDEQHSFGIYKKRCGRERRTGH